MLNQTKRDVEYLTILTEFIHKEYGILPKSIAPAKRGYYGETWRLDTDKEAYFIKVVYDEVHKPLYMRSLPVVEHMTLHGMDFINKIHKSKNGLHYSNFDGAVLGVFDWIDGENIQNERTKFAEYDMLAKVYTVPTEGLDIPHEQFDTDSRDLFYKQWDRAKTLPKCNDTDTLLIIFDTNKDRFAKLSEKLILLSSRCKKDLSHRYITHGDAGGNIIVNDERFYMVDWDDPVIAPPERDAWFCLHWDWATQKFNNALHDNQIDYILHPERLAYYCYHSFFWYLTKYMETYFEYGDKTGELVSEIADYILNGWINDNINYADKHYGINGE